MNYNLIAIFSFSIGVPGITGLLRFRKIDASYYPFIFSLWLGLVNEVTSFLLIRQGYSNAINSNIYVLLESVLLLFFFKQQGLFRRHPGFFNGLLSLYIVLWVSENFLLSQIRKFDSYFIVVYSFSTVLMSISLLNNLIDSERKAIWRNAAFLIVVGFILFYTCTVLIEIFWVYGLNASRSFRFQVYRIMTFVNLFVNLIYTIAVLWMSRKREYTLLS